MITEPQLKIKVGDFVEFNDGRMLIYGLICRIHSETIVDYVRTSMTRWTTYIKKIEQGVLITENDFITHVKFNAALSDREIPSTDQIKKALDLYKANFDVDFSEIVNCFEQ